MKPREAYRVLDRELGPWCGEHGFKRARLDPLAYRAVVRPKWLIVGARCDQWGWDPYAGSSVLVEFRFGPSSDPDGPYPRPLASYLSPDELEYVRVLQNRVIAGRPVPPAEHVVGLERRVRETIEDPELARNMLRAFRTRFEPVLEPYRATSQIWLRYAGVEDLARWAKLVRAVLPRVIDSARREVG